MTIRDLLEQGVSIQGNKVIVRIFNVEKDMYEEILKVNNDLYTEYQFIENKRKWLDKEIEFIYCEDNNLCIDIKGE